jgi:parallel beta-helix repeat protein
MSNRKAISVLAALLACFIFTPATEAAIQTLTGKTVWSKTVTVAEPVVVPAGAELLIEAGTTVRITAPDAQITVSGRLLVKGSAAHPVRFDSPPGWPGITLAESSDESLFEQVQFAGAETAISSLASHFIVRSSAFRNCGTAIKLLRESPIQVEKSRFIDNKIGIDNEMRSEAVLKDNHFSGHTLTAVLASHNCKGAITGNHFENNAQAIGLLQPYPDLVARNTFVNNRVGIYCNQSKNTPKIQENRFEKNDTAIVNFSFAFPAIEDNIFVNNDMAIRNDQYGSALVRHNLFQENKTALYNNRKSNPVIEKNRIVKNARALFCDYSSYPQVRNNEFIDNPMAVELGIYQSADWETRSGSKVLMQKEAEARNSKNAMLAQVPTRFTDIVDVSGNWWGSMTAKLQTEKPGVNLPIFFDRQDKERVVYDGFGPDSYRLDQVVFQPCLLQPVADAGPRKK